MDIGDIVKYNGRRIIIKYFIWDALYNHLKIGKEYMIKNIATNSKGPLGSLYFLINVDSSKTLWYPEECFNFNFTKKYGLI